MAERGSRAGTAIRERVHHRRTQTGGARPAAAAPAGATTSEGPPPGALPGVGQGKGPHPPLANCPIPRVTGPSVPLYLGGARMTYFSAILPISDGMGLVFAVTRYEGRIVISPTSCRELMPDPDLAEVRVYVTQSNHKTLTALRQGSMIHVMDDEFEHEAQEPFDEAFLTHNSTSPHYQIIATPAAGRRQSDAEG